MQNQVIVTTKKEAQRLNHNKHEFISMGGDSELEREDHSQNLKNEVTEFMFTQGDIGHKIMVENHTSVVPDSDEKHSDTTQQNIQMLKDQLDQQQLVDFRNPHSRDEEGMPTNLEIQNV